MFAFAENHKEYSQQDLWDMLPLSQEQRQRIIDDFIKPEKYDKIDEIVKKQLEEEEKKEQEFINSQKEKVI